MCNKIDMESRNIENINIKNIGSLFPNCITETEDGLKIDFDLLKQELSADIVEGNKEKYQLTWPGKKEAVINANTVITKTLRPIKEKSINYNTTQNIYIEGDNLEALKLLQESYLGKIKCIYIDPPYNTGNDFVYKDDFSVDETVELKKEGIIDEYNNKLMANTNSIGRFHSAWLSMMYPRLKLARNLLQDNGVIFISIDDNEVHNLRKICDEIFGENNFIAELINQRAKGGGQAKYIVKGHDYILVYAKNLSHGIELYRKKDINSTIEIDGKQYIKNDDIIRKRFGKYDKDDGDRRCFYEELEKYKGIEKKKEVDALIESGKYFLEENKYGMHTICEYIPVEEAHAKLYSIIKVLSEEGKKDLEKLDFEYFDYPKPVELIKQLIEAVSLETKNGIFLDFFSGSGTTAHAIMEKNAEDMGERKYILVQLPEKCDENSEAYKKGYKTICDIGEERIKRAANSIEKETGAKIDYGFRVFKVDSSNMTDIYYEPSKLSQSQLTMFETNIKEDRTAEDLLVQVILDLGLTLDAKIEEKHIEKNKVYYVEVNQLVACFDDIIDAKIIDGICNNKPLKIVFRENSFKNDSDKINCIENIRKLSPKTEVTVI